MDPEIRYALEDASQEAYEFERAAYALADMAETARWISEATWVALRDAEERFLLLAERARAEEG